MRRPPSNFSPDATLLEKHPELEFDWQPNSGKAHILANYLEHREYRATDPIRWSKPDIFVRADKACGEFAGTLTALQLLSTHASEDGFDEGEPDEPNYKREALLHKLQIVSKQLMFTQTQLERLEAASEYRWLQGHVPGDFTAMPAQMRKHYTNTMALLSDDRLYDLRSVLADAEAIPHMEQGVRTQLDALSVTLEDLERHMHVDGPVFGYNWREARALAVRDYRVCMDTLIPHMCAQFPLIEKELPTMGSYATQVMTNRAGDDGAPSTLTYLDREFKRPAGEEAPDPGAVSNIQNIGEAFSTRRYRERMAEQSKPGNGREGK